MSNSDFDKSSKDYEIIDDFYTDDKSFRDLEKEEYKNIDDFPCQYYMQNGVLHRHDGPAVIVFDPETKKPVMEAWYHLGKLHRDKDKPARIYHVAHEPQQEWYRLGKLHRENGPAFLMSEIDNSGKVTAKIENWYLYGHLHREDGPASVVKNQFAIYEYWFLRGNLHREDGPARSTFTPDGKILSSEEWFQNGLLHRENGPAVITYSVPNREIVKEECFYKGVEWGKRPEINPHLTPK